MTLGKGLMLVCLGTCAGVGLCIHCHGLSGKFTHRGEMVLIYLSIAA